MNRNQMVGSFFGLYLFMPLLAAAIAELAASTARKHRP
jgi:uncharacterized membrane protein